MKTTLHALILVAGMARQLVAATPLVVEDFSHFELFPLINGTPLTDPSWDVSSYEEDDLGVSLVWFSSVKGEAFLALPRKDILSPEVVAPWGESFIREPSQAMLVIQAADQQNWVIDRFDSRLEGQGQRLEMMFDTSANNQIANNYYDILSPNKVLLSGHQSAVVAFDGAISAIYGGVGDLDELYGPDESNIWRIHADGSGSLQAKQWPQPIAFKNFGTLLGSDFSDTFLLLDGVLNVVIEGAGGFNEIIMGKQHTIEDIAPKPSCPDGAQGQDCMGNSNDIRISFVSSDKDLQALAERRIVLDSSAIASAPTIQEPAKSSSLSLVILGSAAGLMGILGVVLNQTRLRELFKSIRPPQINALGSA